MVVSPGRRVPIHLGHKRKLRGNETVALTYNPAVTDADLARLRSVPQLKGLYLAGTQITDADLATLSGLSQLRELALIDMAVTDAGLEHLKGLHALKELSLKHTARTEQAISGSDRPSRISKPSSSKCRLNAANFAVPGLSK